MFTATKSPYLVPFDGKFKRSESPTRPPQNTPGKKKLKQQLNGFIDEISELQRIFYAHDKRALLLIFQAMDAAGKDGTIRAVMSGVNPAGCQIYSFKSPSAEELDHDFLWRTTLRLPERGRIGIFNRSYYEEVLVVKVHPEYLDAQRLPKDVNRRSIWQHRYASIRDHEQHLAENGTIVLKFWLNVSEGEQKKRFLQRLNEPEKHWKFSSSDVRERGYWSQYMKAYENALAATSRSWAPWYAIPADNKPYMRVCVAEIVAQTLKSLNLKYPTLDATERARFDEMRAILESE
ncbi:MAG: polyphosphate kinase 2 family protein [Gammaproteobacteria bacterium]|nr:polyphosphate kinase 2 family protein [Gammaproteobacteria bacterium]MDH3464529.1 polyphosphate kinase 2 family protein [Gammaproteobacteria bacterium]